MKDSVNVVTLEENVTAKDGLRIIPVLFGFGIALLGTIIILTTFWTIIGAFLGFGVLVFGAVLLLLGLPKVKAECPACETSNKVFKGSSNFKCSSCKQTVVVKWIK